MARRTTRRRNPGIPLSLMEKTTRRAEYLEYHTNFLLESCEMLEDTAIVLVDAAPESTQLDKARGSMDETLQDIDEYLADVDNGLTYMDRFIQQARRHLRK